MNERANAFDSAMSMQSLPTPAVPQLPPRLTYLPALDGLRGVAVLLVLWAHLPPAIQPHLALRFLDVVQVGYLGVNLFFVLSGFLITRILVRDRARGLPLRYFFYRRFLRIFPIYYLTIAIVGIAHPSTDVFWCAAYLSNFYFAFTTDLPPLAHTWSLAVEEHFYLIWPAIVYAFPPKVGRWIISLGVIPLAVVSAFAIVLMTPTLLTPLAAKKLIYFATPCEAGSLGLGALLAFAERSVHAARARALVIAIIIGLAGMIAGIAVKPMVTPVTFDAFRLISYAMLSCSVVTIMVSLTDSKILWLARTWVLRSIGRISYGLYLYHFPIFFFLLVYPAPDVGRSILLRRTALAVTLSFAAAITSFIVIEKPLLQLKNRFEPRAA